MMNAPPMPISARMAISSSGEPASAEPSEPRPKTSRPKRQRPLAAEAVAERAGGEQHAGEHEHVDVDDPLQLRGGGVEVALQRRQRDVEDRVVEPDHEQRQAEDGERPPAAGVGASLETRLFRFITRPTVQRRDSETQASRFEIQRRTRTTSKSRPLIRPSVCSWSLLQCGSGAPEMNQAEPLSATIPPYSRSAAQDRPRLRREASRSSPTPSAARARPSGAAPGRCRRPPGGAPGRRTRRACAGR